MLTDLLLETLPVGGVAKDTEVPGLEARMGKRGISFLLYYRAWDGAQRRPKIGAYPALSITKARQIALQWLGRSQMGEDPTEERIALRNSPTVNQLFQRIKKEVYYGKRRWAQESERLFIRHADPALGAMRVRKVGYDDVCGLHQALRGTPVEANRTLSVLSRMFTYAERWGLRPQHSNPCARVERYPESSRRRYASTDELKKIGALLAQFSNDPARTAEVAFLYVLLYSGARPSEIANATPDMLERTEKGVVLRIEEGKTGLRDVFLPEQAMAILDRLPAKRVWLCGRNSVPRKLWDEICQAAGIEGLWARDLRRTFATMGMSHGVNASILGELLGHQSAQTTKIYAKLNEERAHEASGWVAKKLEQALAG